MKESELVGIINKHLKDSQLIYANEIRMGIGIPDVMVGYHIAEELSSIMDYYVLKLYYILVENNIQTINEACELSAWSRKDVLKYLRLLEKSNIISLHNKEITILQRIEDFNLGINLAIEVKVRDWKGGLNQAQRYLCFSDYSYVALPEKAIMNVDTEKFIEYGIGILAIADDRLYEVLNPSKSNKCEHIFKYISVSSILDKFEDENNHMNRADCKIFSVF